MQSDVSSSTVGLRSVAIFEAVKGILVLAAGLGLLTLLHADLAVESGKIVHFLHLDPAWHYPHLFLKTMSEVSPKSLIWFSLAACFYCAIRLIEAYGLWRKRVWAEWMAILSGGMYLPYEFYELAYHLTGVKVAVTGFNVIIVIYLIHTRVNGYRRKHPRPAAKKMS